MARMYPDRIPQSVRDTVYLDAECTVYEALRDQLPEDWSVFAWVKWVLRQRGEGARDGEADFVLAHPEHGLFVLEVKGGMLRADGVSGRWYSASMSGEEHALKESPLSQARRNRYSIEHKLREGQVLPRDGFTFGYTAAFPDCALPDGAVGPDAPRELLLPYGDLERLAERIPSIADYWRRTDGRAELGEDGMAHVTRVLASSFTMPMPLGRSLLEDDRRMIELSESQYDVLDGLSRNRRVVVTGGAGTGKTLLALEKAKRLARDQGFRTLLTCFNRPLAEYLRASSAGIDGLTVNNFHQLCAEYGVLAGHEMPDLSGPDLPNLFVREELPTWLMDALATRGERFEAIVVDEGQDFSATDRAAIELAMQDPAESVLYVFQDQTQAIYRDGSPWPESGMTTYTLTENRRSTQAIHAVLTRLAENTRTRAVGPAGRPPEFIVAGDAREQARALSRVLHRLIREESVAPGTIAVLVSSRQAVPELVEDGRIGAFEVTTQHDDGTERVLIESVTRFKGLERDVVILMRLDPVEYLEYEPMLYVAASRARLHLVVIGDEALVERFRGGMDSARG